MSEPIVVDIEWLNAAGDGVARHRQREITVPFTIPGERVRVSLPPSPPRDARSLQGRILDILRPSPHRVVARCAHFGPNAEGGGPCGGCAWQHIAYPEQLRLKTGIVSRLVAAALPGAPDVRPMLPATPLSDPWGYRHKVHFVVDESQFMGHYVRGSRRIVPVYECPVHDERGNRLAFALADALNRSTTTGAAPARRSSRSQRAGGAGRSAIDRADGADRSRRPARSTTLESVAIRVAGASDEVMATLVVRDDGDRYLRNATRAVLDGQEAPTSLHINLHPRDDGYIFGRETRRITGPARLREVVAGTTFLISPTAFFQTNVRAAELLVSLVLDVIPPAVPVLDLYAGAGLFALPLARAGHAVVAIEENREAVADGEASLRLNGIAPASCRFIAQPVETALHRAAGRRPPRPDTVVVLDPPREGCSAAVVEGVFADVQPRLAVYISCNPEALARDLAAAAAHGYRVQSLQPVDMFPHTAHIETVAVLERRG